MKYTFTIALICFFTSTVFSQISAPVRWCTSINKITETKYELVLTAKIDSAWRFRGIDDDDGQGAIPFTFEIFTTKNIARLDSIESREKPKITYDKVFKDYYVLHKNEANFVQRIHIKDINKDVVLEAAFEFMALGTHKVLSSEYILVTFHIDLDRDRLYKRRIINVGHGDKRIGNCN